MTRTRTMKGMKHQLCQKCRRFKPLFEFTELLTCHGCQRNRDEEFEIWLDGHYWEQALAVDPECPSECGRPVFNS